MNLRSPLEPSVLHPRYKTQYFRNQDWPEEWIEEALRLIRGEWFSRYKKAPPAEAAVDPVVSTGASRESGSVPRASGTRKRTQAATVSQYQSLTVGTSTYWHVTILPCPQTRAMFASLAPGVATQNVDALEAYLEAPPLSTVEDPLEYWNVRFKTDNDKSLTQMALDFLSIPGTSI